jgi:hypothetical protein
MNMFGHQAQNNNLKDNNVAWDAVPESMVEYIRPFLT